MSSSARQQRRIEQRQAQILEVSRRMLVQQGYHGLNMDRIAEAVDYSKGTIYNLFPCKEEIIIALALETMEKRTALFQRAAAFAGQSRERMMAVGVASEFFVRLFPDHFMVEQIIRSPSIWEKTSEKRRIMMRANESRCIGIVAGIARDGVSQGDLRLPDDVSPEDLVFGLWSMNYGGYSILRGSDALPEYGIQDPSQALWLGMHRLLDGYGWAPLSTYHNYAETRARIEREVFPDESRQLA